MKKWNMLLLALMLACMPAAGFAQELPDLFAAVYQGVGEGLAQAAEIADADAQQELTLAVAPEGERIEEGRTLKVTVTAGNPLEKDVAVSFALLLPERLVAAPDAAWDAVIPAAKADPQTGEITPSVVTFTREIELLPGGGSETAQIGAEMSMGTRFYRAQADVQLCVPDVTIEAALEGAQEGRLTPGSLAVYQIDVRNGGTAPKDVALALTLPQGAAAERIPAGFVLAGGVLRGTVRAEAAQEEPFHQAIRVPLRIAEDILEGDEDASRLIAGTLTADGERIALPRMQVCGPKVSARLIADKMNLEAGEETTLRVVLANSGLAAADVQVSCVLPEGLALGEESKEAGETAATPGEAVLPHDDDTPAMAAETSALAFDVHMNAAEQTADGVTAYTQVIEIPVTALEPQEKLQEQLLGATLAWQVDGDEPQLAQAVAMRVYRPAFLGISGDDWNGIFWAALLLMITIACLCAAVKNDKRQEDFCCE